MAGRSPNARSWLKLRRSNNCRLPRTVAFLLFRPRLPLGRIGKPDEIGGLVSWLAGPDAGYMTGASLTIDGGWTA